MSMIKYELDEVKKLCENVVKKSKIVSCNETLVRVDLIQTPVRQLSVCLRFPGNYPNNILLIELKSKTLNHKLLDKITEVCETNIKVFKNKPQIMEVIKFINNFLLNNPLIIIYDEINNIKKQLNENEELKLKQKKSQLEFLTKGGEYFCKLIINVPDEYPSKSICWDNLETNLPTVLMRYLNGQAKEIARQCVEVPIRATVKEKELFVPKPSLEKTLNFLIASTRDFHIEACPVCDEKCLPENPANLILNDNDNLYVERTYCGHLYHAGCLKKYLNEPPFTVGGKLCPAKTQHLRSDYKMNTSNRNNINDKSIINKCMKRLSHDRWGLTVKLAEARWALKQAKKRELEEVIDFLQ